jgi:circadian clock protein KaiC
MKHALTKRSAAAAGASLAKAPSGIRGLDDVLLGGVPRGRTTLVGGGPGTGKTILALEVLYRGALAGEPGLLVTFEEEAEAIRRNAATLGWDLPALEQDGKLVLMQADVPTDVEESGEFDIGGLLAVLAGHVRALGIKRLAIDAVDVLLRLFSDARRAEDQLIVLHKWLGSQDLTTVLTVKTSGDALDTRHRLEYMTDCVLRLDHRVLGQLSTRRLRVLKYRGSRFLSNEFPYLVANDGIVLMPITSVQLAAGGLGARFASGIRGLDALLDGGLFSGSSVLVAGESGTGKTIFASSMAAAACARGERVLYISFEESPDNLIGSVRSAGVDLRTHIESGALRLMSTIPETLGVEEHLWEILQVLQPLAPHHVVVDAISACQRMGSEEAGFDFLLRLVMECKSRRVTCIYLNQIESRDAAHRTSGVGISSVIDALLVLEQDWPNNDHQRRMLVVKMRGSAHAHGYQAFRISDHGFAFEEAVTPGRRIGA